MEKSSNIPKQHQLKCDGCGKIIDMRDPGQVLAHGWIENGKIVCYDEEQIEYEGSQQIGDPVFYTKDKNPLYLS